MSEQMLEWLAAIGAAGVVELADAGGIAASTAAARLRRLEAAGLVQTVRLLHGKPALYVITRAGLRTAGRGELAPVRVSSFGFAHLLECGRVARALSCALAGSWSVHSERELRAWERASGRVLASAELRFGARGARERHRPDLVCMPLGGGLPVAIEVELTVKAPVRLREIVRGWARCRCVAGVVYYAAPAALRALERAITDERASAAVQALELARAGELPGR
jgi:DNA-binding Lrp family transcriptional regulator